MKKLFILMSVVVFSFASCGDDKDSKDADSKKSKDVNGGSGDTWGACDCIKYQDEMTAKIETASEEDQKKLIEEGNATINSKCSAYKGTSEAALNAACEEESKKAAKKNAESGQQDQSAGNQNGDICDCLMAAMEAEDEEQAMACDPSKSEDEMKAILNECLSGRSKYEERSDGDNGGDYDEGDYDEGDYDEDDWK